MSLYFFLEIISTLSGMICVYLQTRENIKAWPFGILSVTLAVFIFYKEMLYSDFILHNIYIVLNIYGWWFWNKKNKNNSSISSYSIKLIRNTQLLFYLMAILILSFVWGNYMDKHFNASFPYLDAFTTIGSLIAQYLLARKILQNWLIWIAVDFVAIGVYLAKDLYFFSGLFTVYLILCIKGYLDWRKPLRYNHPKTA